MGRVATGFATFDSDAVADFEIERRIDIGPERSDDTGGFVSEHQRFADGKVSVTTVNVVVD